MKNMLLHSREGSGEHRPVDINALVEEGLNLAYHGARRKSRVSMSPWSGHLIRPQGGRHIPQDITRVL